MTNSVTKYRKELKKQLQCSHKIKKNLLASFDAMVASFLEETASPAPEQLEAAFGAPESMAQTLMAGITPEEQVQYRRKKREVQILTGILVGICAVLLAVFTVWVYAVKAVPVEVEYEAVVYETNPVLNETEP